MSLLFFLMLMLLVVVVVVVQVMSKRWRMWVVPQAGDSVMVYGAVMGRDGYGTCNEELGLGELPPLPLPTTRQTKSLSLSLSLSLTTSVFFPCARLPPPLLPAPPGTVTSVAENKQSVTVQDSANSPVTVEVGRFLIQQLEAVIEAPAAVSIMQEQLAAKDAEIAELRRQLAERTE